MALSMDAYCMEKCEAGIMLLMLEIWVLWGEERSMTNLFFPKNFWVAMPMGLMWKGEMGGFINGPIMNPSWISLPINESTVSGSERAKCMLWEIWEVSGFIFMPWWKPFFNPLIRKSTNSQSGCFSKAVARAFTLTGVLRCLSSQSGRVVGLWGQECLRRMSKCVGVCSWRVSSRDGWNYCIPFCLLGRVSVFLSCQCF